jgi:5-formyltetrahydrofolate cyclo-ligase
VVTDYCFTDCCFTDSLAAMDAASKTELRARARALIRAVQPEERQSFAEKHRQVMLAQEIWQRARNVLLFSPLPDEPDITALLEEAWRAGKMAALPQTNPDTGGYIASIIRNREELRPGRFGVPEPAAGCPVIPLNQLDLVLVPGVAFDSLGGRLGRGKGFYDRLLAEVRGHKCGVAFDVQIVPSVPVESHDIRVDSILTPTRWHLCPRPA